MKECYSVYPGSYIPVYLMYRYVYMELQDYPWYHIIGQDGSAISALLRDTTGIYDAIFFMLWRQNEATF